MILIFILYALFAITFIIGKEVVCVAPPIFFTGIRMIISGILLLTFTTLTQKKPVIITRKELPWFAGIVFFHIYTSYVAEFVALQYLSGAMVALLFNLAPFITAILAYAFFKDTLSKQKWVGLVLGFLAFIPVLITGSSAHAATSGHNFLAELLLLYAVLASCIGWIFMKKLITDFKHSYIFVNGIGMLLGGMLSLGHSFLTETWPLVGSLVYNVVFIRSLILLILIGNVISYNLYGKLLHRYSATTLSFFGITTPIFTALFERLWLKEAVSTGFYATAFLVSIGLYIFYQEELGGGPSSAVSKVTASQEEEGAR